MYFYKNNSRAQEGTQSNFVIPFICILNLLIFHWITLEFLLNIQETLRNLGNIYLLAIVIKLITGSLFFTLYQYEYINFSFSTFNISASFHFIATKLWFCVILM